MSLHSNSLSKAGGVHQRLGDNKSDRLTQMGYQMGELSRVIRNQVLKRQALEYLICVSYPIICLQRCRYHYGEICLVNKL